jgi:hypothetical protein
MRLISTVSVHRVGGIQHFDLSLLDLDVPKSPLQDCAQKNLEISTFNFRVLASETGLFAPLWGKETFITCCTYYFFAYRKKLRNLV